MVGKNAVEQKEKKETYAYVLAVKSSNVNAKFQAVVYEISL